MIMKSLSFCVFYLLLTFSYTKVAAQEGPGIVIAHPGQDVELLCTVTVTSATQAAAWLINNMGPYRINSIRGGILAGYTGHLGSNNLIVENIMMNDDRNGSDYRCVIVPALGLVTLAYIMEESDPAILYIVGVPAMVSGVKVDHKTINGNGNNITLTLSWGEPFNNLDPIVNYTVSCSGDDACPPNFTTTDNTTRSHTITNLTPMTNYTFSVVATNSIGSGEAGVGMFTTPGVPAMVPVVTVDDNTININGNIVTLTLIWGEPFNNFDPIVNYTVSCSGDDTCPPNFTTTDSTTRSYTITNLTLMANYTFSVVATNSIGSGEAGVAMISTLGVPAMVPGVTVDSSTININGNIVTLTLSWGEPFNNFDPIESYTVSCSGDETCPPNFTTTNSTTRSHTITNLAPMTNYTFSVVATNSIGSGEAGVVMIITPGPVYGYYLGFFVNYNINDGRISILLTTSDIESVEYSIEAPGVGYFHNGTISAGDEVTLNLSLSVQVSSYNDQDKGICLTASSDKITVIGQYLGSRATSDSYFALPIIKLDSAKYVYYGISVPRTVVHSQLFDSSILIVGTENNTALKLTTTQPVDAAVGNTVISLIPSREYSFVINRLQTFYIGSLEDLSGTKVVTDRPVSVFSGHQCANVPWNVVYCDHLIEQMLPTALWGDVYYTAPFVDKRSYTVKVLAANNNTVVNIYCNNVMESHVINEGGFVNRTSQLQEYCAIYSNKEVIVAQFSHGGDEDNRYGDPMMTLVPATNQYLNKFVLSTIRNPLRSGYTHYVNIIVMEQYYQPNMIYLISGGVNRSLDKQQWIPIQVNNTIKAYATQINISEGATQIFHFDDSAQLMTIAYGFTVYGGYGHIGGIDISEDIDECTQRTDGCDHNCTNTDGSYYCTCADGYELESDDHTCTDIDECTLNIDDCDQKCVNDIGSYHCECYTGYFRDNNSVSCVDINECARDHGCHHLCNNTDGSFHCYCNPGYMLHLNRTTCTDINECFVDSGGCEFSCTNLEGINSTTGIGYQCGCDIGYQLAPNNHDCNDIDECTQRTNGCDHNCTNTDGSYYCTCMVGYELEPDNRTCTDIDECIEGSDGCDHNCTNTDGSYYCTCIDGYKMQLDNHTCTDINECVGNHGCYHFCNNTDGSFHCYCNPGYMLHSNGATCTDVDECLVDNGGCEFSCTNLKGINNTTGLGYQCGCDIGYQLAPDNHNCNDIDECTQGTDGCDHNCTNTDGSYYCTCRDGYELESDNHTCTVVGKGKCILTPINPTTLTSAGGTLPNGTERVMIQCNCTNDNGKKINHVRWYDPDGNELLSPRSRHFNDDVPYFTRVTDRDNTNIILVIPMFTSSFDGIYTCGKRVNRGLPGPPNASVNLTIDVSIPVITRQPMDAAIQLITNFTNHTLTCKADKASSYCWEKENDVIPSDSTGVYTNRLTLINLQPEDAGNYQCVATNALGTSKSDYAIITIFVHAPRVISHPTSTYAASPFGALFSCSIQVYGYLTITWYRRNKNPVQSKASSTVKHSANVTTSVLYIPNVTSEDVDTYFCEAWANRMAAQSQNAKLSLTVPPPQPPVVVTVNSINLTINDYHLTMKCLPYQSNFHYMWIKGNDIIPLRAQGMNSSQLSIVNLKPEDSGSYRCVMSNSTGTISSSFVMIDIKVSMPTISEQPNNMTIDIFESVSFNCSAHGFGLLEIIWERIRHVIPVTAKITQIKSLNEITSVLKITNSVGYYSGQYRCIAKNVAGKTISQIANLNVIVPMPEIIICPKKDVAVFPNDNFTMSCLALSFGSLKYNWSKREGLLPPRAKVSFKYISHKATNVYNLEVYNVQPSDEGSYCCKATNEGGSSVCCAWLEVNSLPSITTQPIPKAFKLGDVNVTAMSCSAVGMGTMYFQWEKYDPLNNSWISPSHRALNIMSSDLKFSVITEDDEGVYRCNVTNNDGSVISDNATIHVYGPPIIKFITNHTVKQEGQKVNLICSAVNDFDAIHPLQINWYKGNKLVIQIERQVVLYIAPDNVSREQNLTLTIDQVNHTDDGEYTCRAFNHNDSFSELKTSLTVQSPPIISISNKSPYKTSVGRFPVLHCTATGKPIPIVEWYINDNIIKNPFPTIPHSSRGSRLLLVPTHKPDTIIYTCKGINYIENIKYISSANITVIVEKN